MAFTSIGYDGSVNERQWAELVPSVGSSTYGVKGAGDLKVTAVPGQPLMVSVAAGTGWGHGVIDTEIANTTITCDAISSGTRWDLIAIRRDWQPLAGGPTSVVKVTGTAEKVIPASRKQVPGVWDDQPIALVQWTAGQTQPTSIIDLRCWGGNGGLNAVDELALTYLAKLGAKVRIGGNVWSCEIGANDVVQWVNETTSGDVDWTALSTVQGFTPNNGNGWAGPRYKVKSGMVTINGSVNRSSPWPELTCAVMPQPYRPTYKVQGSGVQVEPTAGNITLPPGSTAASFSVQYPL